MVEKPGKIRRKVLLNSAAIGSALVGMMPASANKTKGDQKKESPPRNSNPSDQATKRQAHQLLRIESLEEAERVFKSYSTEQQNSLKKPLLESSVEVGAEVNKLLDSAEGTVTTKIHNAAGGVEAKFEHHIYWEYDGDEVTDISTHTVGTSPGWLWYFRGTETDHEDIRGDYGVSTKTGRFEQCFSKWGCARDWVIGSDITVYADGGWDYSKID